MKKLFFLLAVISCLSLGCQPADSTSTSGDGAATSGDAAGDAAGDTPGDAAGDAADDAAGDAASSDEGN